MPTIPLSRGLNAIVDEADYAANSRYSWFAQRCGGNRMYAARKDRSEAKENVLYMHHAIAGKHPGMVVDHINGDSLDNRRANLRVCSMSQNIVNSSQGRKPGVFVCKQTGRYGARTAVEGKRVFLGRFDTFEDAANAVAAFRETCTFPGTGHADCRGKALMSQRLMLKEQGTQNPRVGGSNPPLGTIKSLDIIEVFGCGNLGNSGTERGHRTHVCRHGPVPGYSHT